jgi:hypothetical protein
MPTDDGDSLGLLILVAGFLGIVFAPLILAGVSWGFPWAAFSVRFPVRCGSQGAAIAWENDFFYCPRWSDVAYNESYVIGISLEYASILKIGYRPNSIFYYRPSFAVSQDVKWSEFTAENMCNKASLIYQQYSLRYGICSESGELLVGGSYITAASAAIATMVMFPIFLSVSAGLVYMSWKRTLDKRHTMCFSFVLAISVLVPAAFTMYNWNYFAVPVNYLSNNKMANVVPIWNLTIVFANNATSPEQYADGYTIQRTNEIIPSPNLYDYHTVEGYSLWIGAIAAVCFYLVCILPLTCYILFNSRDNNTNPTPDTTDPTLPPPTTELNDQEMEAQDPIVQKLFNEPSQVPRPSRPAPLPSEDGEPFDITNVALTTV